MFLKLVNGVKMHLLKDENVDLLLCKLFILTGSKGDLKNKEGLAHLVEHLMFKGSKSFKDSEHFSSYLKKRCIDFNAKTSRDFICFDLKCLKENAKDGIKTLVDMVSNTYIRTDDFQDEKKVIIEEIELEKIDEETIVRERLETLIWSNYSYIGKPLIGNQDSLLNISINDIQTFITQYFTAENILFCLYGDFEEASVIEEVGKIGGGINEKNNQVTVCHESLANNDIFVVNREVNENLYYTSIGFKLHRGYKRESFDILNQYINSNLFDRIRRLKSLVYHIDSRPSFYNQGYEFLIEFYSARNNKQKIVDLILTELKTLRNIDYKDLYLAKKSLKRKLLLIKANPDRYTYWLGRNFSLNLHPVEIDNACQEIMNFSMESCIDVIENGFNINKRAITLYNI